MLLTTLMQQDAGGPGDLVSGPSRTPRVVPSSQLEKQKCSLFQTTPSWGWVCAGSIISRGGSSEPRTWKQRRDQAEAGTGREGPECTPSRPTFPGSCLDSTHEGCPGTTCSILGVLGRRRLGGGQVRPGGFPVAPSPRTFSMPLTSGALLPVTRRQAQEHALHPALDSRPPEDGDFHQLPGVNCVHRQQGLAHPLHFRNHGSVWA